MSYSEDNSYEEILSRCLENERLKNMDKRAGSIIYDTLAPFALELAEAYIQMDVLESLTYLMTAKGTSLDKRVYDYGMARTPATYAKRIATFKKYKTNSSGDYETDESGNKILVDMDIPEDTRFAVPNDTTITYKYVGKTDGYNILQCEQLGTSGNTHLGQVLPLSPVANLIEARITSTYTPAEDAETDEDLRARAKKHLNYMTYGGNISDYIERVNALDGVGETKVFPAWQYNGSVLLSIVSPTFDPISSEFARSLKEQIDPEEDTGQGVGFAPIGHFVTVTTPSKKAVDIALNLVTEVDVDDGEVAESVVDVIETIFEEERKKYAQNVRLAIYTSKIVQDIRNKVSGVIDVTDVTLNGLSQNIVYTDIAEIGGQNLPYVRSVTIGENTLIVDDTLEVGE